MWIREIIPLTVSLQSTFPTQTPFSCCHVDFDIDSSA
jgi:hypothetical protein